MMEKKFDTMVSKYRISLRVGKELSKLKKMSAFTEAKKGITEAINNEIPYEAGASELKNVLEQIELCQRNIKILAEVRKRISCGGWFRNGVNTIRKVMRI